MRVTQRHAAQGEGVEPVVAFGQRPEIAEQGHGGVVLGGLAGGDQCFDLGPGGFFVVGQVVQSFLAGEGSCVFAAGFLLSKLRGFLALPFVALAPGAVQEFCHRAAAGCRDRQRHDVAESAQYLHSCSRSVSLGDLQQ